MKSIEIYDPALCCSSGVCGPEPDEKLARFAADIKWLKEQGVEVTRFNLSQEPKAFVSNPTVKEILDKHGDSCLPLVLADGEVITRSIYPSREQLADIAGIQQGGCCEGDSCCPEEPEQNASSSCCANEGQSSCC